MDHEIYRKTLLKKDSGKRAAAGMLPLCVVLMSAALSFSGCGKKELTLSDVIKETAEYEMKTVPKPGYGTLAGEWTVMSLARSGEEVEDSYWDIYKANLEKAVKEAQGNLSERKYTEYSRVILALNSIGEDPEDVGGYNLVLPLEDFDTVVSQGLNGGVYALLALNSDGSGDSSIKEQYLEYVLEQEKPEGGFSMDSNSDEAEADMTAMAIQCLEPYQDRQGVQEVIERGIQVLSDCQAEEGGYVSYGEDSSESLSQTIIALSAYGIDCNEDERFVKDGKGLYDILMEYRNEDGGFSHVKGDESDLMPTDQAFCALVAYERMKEDKNSFYNMTDHR
ncbi:prenyltransferase/squalene oxidase repeat-containing protein [Ruminococcus sp. 5_1_39BFAA]|uniref:prenyltransferase/squalene oxidase repeat-containing protein n=1 Tax=Ruminococcus sp. 5_1_39BFAA TaxID=457412 RepID=UPI003563EA0D